MLGTKFEYTVFRKKYAVTVQIFSMNFAVPTVQHKVFSKQCSALDVQRSYIHPTMFR